MKLPIEIKLNEEEQAKLSDIIIPLMRFIAYEKELSYKDGYRCGRFEALEEKKK